MWGMATIEEPEEATGEEEIRLSGGKHYFEQTYDPVVVQIPGHVS